MHIRMGTAQERMVLRGQRALTNTDRFFAGHMASGNATLFAWDRDGELVGELYLFRSLSDPDFADGTARAYFCALLIREDLRGQGLGTALMEHVAARAKEEGFTELTIGVDFTEEANIRLYRRMGFTELVKDCVFDPCSMDENMRPEAHSGFHLLLKRL